MTDLGPDEFDEWYAEMEVSPRRDQIVAQTLGLPPELQSSSLLPWDAIADVSAALELGSDDVLADLACGRGGYGLELARRTGCRVVGVDFSRVAIAQAGVNADRFGVADRASFAVGSLLETGLDDASVDAIVCVDAIGFAEPIIDALREMKRVLRPGGRVAITAWEARDRNDERVSERQRRCDLGRDLSAAGFTGVSVDTRDDWHSQERALWEAALAEEDYDDDAMRSLREEAEHVLAQFDGSRRVFARALA